MARRCDRCRVEYETGVDYGGKDYCMTCYVRVKQEEEIKIRKEREAQEKREMLKEKYIREQLEKEMREREAARKSTILGEQEAAYRRQLERYQHEQHRKEEEEKRRQEIMHERMLQEMQLFQQRAQQKRQEEEEEEKKKHDWDVKTSVVYGEEKKEGALKKPRRQFAEEVPFQLKKTSMPGVPLNLPEREEVEVRYSSDFEELPAEILLDVRKSLPVSLSCGQKKNSVILVGKNNSPNALTVDLRCQIYDSKQKEVPFKAEPEHCAIAGGSAADFTIRFDLPDEIPTGVLTLTAQLKENAVYVGREAAKSKEVVITTKIKTPLSLEYKKGSACFAEEEGKLLLQLEFSNRGESGGTLNENSSVSYGKAGSLEKALLGQKAKIKGRQRKVILKFPAQKKCEIEVLSFEFFGVDSNGKPYRLVKNVKERQAPGEI